MPGPIALRICRTNDDMTGIDSLITDCEGLEIYEEPSTSTPGDPRSFNFVAVLSNPQTARQLAENLFDLHDADKSVQVSLIRPHGAPLLLEFPAGSDSRRAFGDAVAKRAHELQSAHSSDSLRIAAEMFTCYWPRRH